jgi:nitrate/nitrite-specific signal transduction histidine kinase
VVRQPPEVAIKLAVQVQKTVIAVGVVVGVLGVLMVWWLAGRLNRPLVDMARAADRIAAGDRSVHMGHHRGAAELMQVSAAVDHMTRELLQREQALVASRDELERKVRERTAELQASNAELARANTELDNLSRHDALTKLPNRRAADERLLHELARHRRSQTPLTLMTSTTSRRSTTPMDTAWATKCWPRWPGACPSPAAHRISWRAWEARSSC